jgi:hypothetical protein
VTSGITGGVGVGSALFFPQAQSVRSIQQQSRSVSKRFMSENLLFAVI